MMLANPNLAPFELVNPPEHKQDWILIDHLMTIFKVKPDDYVAAEPALSIVNMARTLASRYMSETKKAKHVVLVKDGHGAQKPAVRDVREKYQPEPHIQFCKDNLHAIEYTMMKLLCDTISKDKFFLVTGANTAYMESARKDRESRIDQERAVAKNDGIIVSFHDAYVEYLSREDHDLSAVPEDYELSDVDPSYADGKISRPEGFDGVFLVTFAEPENTKLAILRDACLLCASTEADTLMVELGNILDGAVTISSGDSDLIAVFTSCAREGVTLRVDNLSYRNDQKMHTSPFGELLFGFQRSRVVPPLPLELTSDENRFRVLCDIEEDADHLVHETRVLHDRWESALTTQRSEIGVSLEALVRYLYLGGIRGSVYTEFLRRLFSLSNSETLEVVKGVEGVVRADTQANRVGRMFDYIFGDLSSCSPRRGAKRSHDNVDPVPQEHEHVHLVHEPECVPSKHLEHSVESNAFEVNTLTKKELSGLKKLSKLYAEALVPKGSHGRFLKLTQTKWHFHMRIRQEVLCSDITSNTYLIFIILCGTDYNYSLPQMGSKRLMVCASDERFSLWCQQLTWYSESQDDKLYHDAALTLAKMATVPRGVVSKLWTRDRCAMIMKNMKYVYELWHLKHPTPGPEYGLTVIEGMVRYDIKSSDVDAYDVTV